MSLFVWMKNFPSIVQKECDPLSLGDGTTQERSHWHWDSCSIPVLLGRFQILGEEEINEHCNTTSPNARVPYDIQTQNQPDPARWGLPLAQWRVKGTDHPRVTMSADKSWLWRAWFWKMLSIQLKIKATRAAGTEHLCKSVAWMP